MTQGHRLAFSIGCGLSFPHFSPCVLFGLNLLTAFIATSSLILDFAKSQALFTKNMSLFLTTEFKTLISTVASWLEFLDFLTSTFKQPERALQYRVMASWAVVPREDCLRFLWKSLSSFEMS